MKLSLFYVKTKLSKIPTAYKLTKLWIGYAKIISIKLEVQNSKEGTL